MNEDWRNKTVDLPSVFEGIKFCYDLANSYKDLLNLDFDQFFKFQTLLLESVQNAIIHGNKSNPGLIVSLNIRVINDTVFFTISDSGDGFDFTKVVDPIHPDFIDKECGRGLFFIKKLADTVEFSNSGSKILISMSI